jgi:hypothetical protein
MSRRPDPKPAPKPQKPPSFFSTDGFAVLAVSALYLTVLAILVCVILH